MLISLWDCSWMAVALDTANSKHLIERTAQAKIGRRKLKNKWRETNSGMRHLALCLVSITSVISQVTAWLSTCWISHICQHSGGLQGVPKRNTWKSCQYGNCEMQNVYGKCSRIQRFHMFYNYSSEHMWQQLHTVIPSEGSGWWSLFWGSRTFESASMQWRGIQRRSLFCPLLHTQTLRKWQSSYTEYWGNPINHPISC